MGRIVNLYSSQKSKRFILPNTGMSSSGFLSFKKQSKVHEDLEINSNTNQTVKKFIPPSPVVKLNKRIPKKEVSKVSKASKSSSKKSSKKRGMKRVPRKYMKPNLTEDKLSNKSLVNRALGNNDLLRNSNEESKETPLHTGQKLTKISLFNQKTRFSVRNDNITDKQAVILEDQNEYDYISEDDSSSSEETFLNDKSQNSISSIHSDEEMPPNLIQMVKASSQALRMDSQSMTNENEYIEEKMRELTKKTNSKMPGIRQANLLPPHQNFGKYSTKQISLGFQGKGNLNNSNPRVIQTRQDF